MWTVFVWRRLNLPRVFISPSRVQPRLLPLPPGLCQVVSTGLHVGAAAPQPFPGELGGPVHRPSLPALQPSMPHLLWQRANRLPVLPSSQPPGPHLLPAPEPGPTQIPSRWGTPGWRSRARRGHPSSSRQQRRRWGTSGDQRRSVHSAACRRGRAQLCLYPGRLRRGFPLAADPLRWSFFGLEDQTALCVFRDEGGAGGLWLWLWPRTGEEGTDLLQGDPHCVGGRGHDHLRVWIRQRGSGRSLREDSFYQDAELHLTEACVCCAGVAHHDILGLVSIWDLTEQSRHMKKNHTGSQALPSRQHPSNCIKYSQPFVLSCIYLHLIYLIWLMLSRCMYHAFDTITNLRCYATISPLILWPIWPFFLRSVKREECIVIVRTLLNCSILGWQNKTSCWLFDKKTTEDFLFSITAHWEFVTAA